MNRRSLLSRLSALVVLICGSLMGAGCATSPPIARPVDVPVYVSCVKRQPERPAFDFESLPANASDGQKILALARDWARGRKYENDLEAVVSGCQ